jgi:hypothetical protein
MLFFNPFLPTQAEDLKLKEIAVWTEKAFLRKLELKFLAKAK